MAEARIEAIPVKPWSAAILTVTSVAGLFMFGWPLLIPVQPSLVEVGASGYSPYIFVAVLPILVLLTLAQMSDGGMDSKALAMLGVLSAINAALRPLGAGVQGIELVFFLLILAGRVFGPGFGFLLGCTSMFASALLTAGVGPWLPFQMLCAAWIGMFAGLLPRSIFGTPIRGAGEIALLAIFAVVAAYGYGLLMNLWFWPFLTAATMSDPGLSYIPAAEIGENLHRFIVFTLISSTATWDTGRAITSVIAVVVVGPAVLLVLRRAARRAHFEPGPLAAGAVVAQ